MEIIEIGKGRKLKDGKDLAILSIGPIGNAVSAAISEIEKEGFSIGQYDMIFLKPIDGEILKEVASTYNRIITVENGVITGGLGSAVLEYFSDNGYKDKEVMRVGLPDKFVTHGSVKDLNHLCGIDVEGITKKIHDVLTANKG